jgi:DNA-binding winged helix-turn-helix (wHTH) protein
MPLARENPTADSVAVVHWPRDNARRAQLAAARVPCLLLVEPEATPPVVELWEDWIQLPADERDVSIRLQGLAVRVCRPEIVDNSILRNSYGTVTLSSQESAMAQALLESQGRLVSRAELERTLWPEGMPTARALDDLVYRLRRKVKPLQLSVFSARQRGFVLGVAIEVTPAAPHTESGASDE